MFRNIEDITFSSPSPDFTVTCTDKPQIPLPMSGKWNDALVWDDKPVLCGGLVLTSECHIYRNNAWTLLANMNEERAISSSIGFPQTHGSNTGFWITGVCFEETLDFISHGCHSVSSTLSSKTYSNYWSNVFDVFFNNQPSAQFFVQIKPKPKLLELKN